MGTNTARMRFPTKTHVIQTVSESAVNSSLPGQLVVKLHYGSCKCIFKWKVVNNFNIFFIEVCSSGYDWWEVNIDLDNGFRLTDKKGKLISKPMMTHFNDTFRTMELLQSCTKPSIYATKGRNELNAQANTIETHRNAVGFFFTDLT